VRFDELDLRELLDFDPRGGILRFGGQRAVILDAVALGLLRRELIDTLGVTAARAVLTRFGFAHGWRTAESLRDGFPWDTERDWQLAGGRLHTLQGLLRMEPVPERPGGPFAEAIWHEPYEAEQHLLHLGQSETPVCWTHCGFASGYMSRVQGARIYCIETRCVGRGDAVCRVEGRFREEWDERHADELAFFERAPLDDILAQLTQTLKRTERALSRRRREVASAGGELDDSSGLITASPAMRRSLETARRVAAADVSVLITGESGVGKERIARLVHDESPRAPGPFVAINCGAVPEGLLESELFGHVQGAFTGATRDRSGLFEAANGGTLLLDEVGDVPPSMQARLLRVLEEREVRRVGDNTARPVDVRIIAATHRNLRHEIQAGRFREDLYYRLRVVELDIPPLRERRDDILPLARFFLRAASERAGGHVVGISPDAADRITSYRWPGNVRELRNVVERALVMEPGARLRAASLPEEVRNAAHPSVQATTVRPLAEVERDHILAALRANGGHRERTAAQLGIGVATLYRKLRTYHEASDNGRATKPTDDPGSNAGA
jgi:DNA-binding NtrC family response regulator